MADLEIIAIHDIGEVRPGDDLAEQFQQFLREQRDD